MQHVRAVVVLTKLSSCLLKRVGSRRDALPEYGSRYHMVVIVA
jgi:hypothetical protein